MGHIKQNQHLDSVLKHWNIQNQNESKKKMKKKRTMAKSDVAPNEIVEIQADLSVIVITVNLIDLTVKSCNEKTHPKYEYLKKLKAKTKKN